MRNNSKLSLHDTCLTAALFPVQHPLFTIMHVRDKQQRIMELTYDKYAHLTIAEMKAELRKRIQGCLDVKKS